ncbi:MAG: SDR family oxidoreductase [Betaproteobacteria bacterium]|nr:SDR family oxidoreductase [Betaproteobacteria bacterium]MDH3436834.1 SDR family oxidoreductase [Betaproteobacteria bacterium]
MSTQRPTALVTGASQGIGAAIAVGLAQNGFDVAVSSTHPEKLSDVLSQLAATGARSVPLELDVCSHPSIAKAMGEAIGAFGQVDVLVNNAGIPLKKPAVDITAEEWDCVMNTNVTGTFFMSQEMGRHLLAARRPGCIINIASTHGLVSLPERAAYSIAKAAVIHMARVLAVEWAGHGIRVNAIVPGRVDTASRAGSLAEPGYRDMALSRIPLRRFATSDEIAAAVCYLASPEAGYITGQALVLDGGLTAQ